MVDPSSGVLQWLELSIGHHLPEAVVEDGDDAHDDRAVDDVPVVPTGAGGGLLFGGCAVVGVAYGAGIGRLGENTDGEDQDDANDQQTFSVVQPVDLLQAEQHAILCLLYTSPSP